MTARPSRPDMVARARSWIGTPYAHGQSLRGAGCDCLGLVRGLWREAYGHEPETLGPYSPDWAEIDPGEPLLRGLDRHFTAVPLAEAVQGDVLAFRLRARAAAKHVAILSDGSGIDDPRARIIHAYCGHAVVCSWLHPFWRGRLCAAYAFPAAAIHDS